MESFKISNSESVRVKYINFLTKIMKFSIKYINEQKIFYLSQSLFFMSISLSSQEKMAGFSRWYSRILDSPSGVVFLFLFPPIDPGLIDPVSWYLKFKVNTVTPSCIHLDANTYISRFTGVQIILIILLFKNMGSKFLAIS